MRAVRMLPAVWCVVSLSISVWIIAPASARIFWLMAVAVGECGLFFALLTAMALLIGIRTYRARRSLLAFALLTGCIAIGIESYPTFSAFHAAREQGINLSWKDYFFLSRESGAVTMNTRVYAVADGQQLKLDEYHPPANLPTHHAAIIVVHGGSWHSGRRSDFPQWDRWLARQGYAVFDIDYRLSPQPNWRSATGDVKCAVQWVRRHSAEYQISPERVVLMGRSAGAHLALLAAYSAGNDVDIPSSCGGESAYGTADEKVIAVISMYAPTDLTWAYSHPANQKVLDGPATLRRFLGGTPNGSQEEKASYRQASPSEYVGAGTPATFLAQGGHDQLVRSQNLWILDGKLKAAGIPHETVYLDYAQHGFDWNIHSWGSQIVKAKLVAFLNKNLGDAVR